MVMMMKRKITSDVGHIEFEVLSPHASYNGKSYGEWLAESWKKLLSEDPDKPDGSIFFLRTSPNPEEISTFQKTAKISSDQAVFVPVASTAINKYDIPDLDTEEKRRSEANKYTDEVDSAPEAWHATIDGQPIVPNLKEFRVQSPEFDLTVSEKSPIRKKLDTTYEPGTEPTVAAGYCIIIKSLPARDKPYNIHIRSDGRYGYRTESRYTLHVN